MANHTYGQLAGGIGDYIHYHQNNYRLYGINRRQEGKSLSATHALKESREELKKLLRNSSIGTKAEILSNYLNEFFYGLPDISTQDKQQWHIGWTSNDYVDAQNMLTQEIQKRLPFFVADLTSLSFLDALSEQGENIAAELKPYTSVRGGKKTQHMRKATMDRVQGHLQELMNRIQALQTNGLISATGESNMDKLIDWYNKCEILAQKISNELMKNSELTIREIDSNGKYVYTNLGLLLRDFNTLIKNVLKPNKDDFGDLGEIGLAYALAVGSSVGKQGISDVMKILDTSLVGKQGSRTHYNRLGNGIYVDKVVSDMNTYQYTTKSGKQKTVMQDYYNYDPDTGQIWSVRASQDTVDISMEFQNNSYLQQKLGVDRLNASIKNVNSIYSKWGTHVLGSAPLMAILELTTTNFVNHYLNLLACNDGYGRSGEENNDLRSYENLIMYATVVRSLAGFRSIDNPNATKYSDCFIVNDRKAKKIYVWDTAHLINKISKLGDGIRDVVSGPTHSLPNSLSNEFVFWTKTGSDIYNYGAANYRISRIIAQIQKYKISASLHLNKLL